MKLFRTRTKENVVKLSIIIYFTSIGYTKLSFFAKYQIVNRLRRKHFRYDSHNRYSFFLKSLATVGAANGRTLTQVAYRRAKSAAIVDSCEFGLPW